MKRKVTVVFGEWGEDTDFTIEPYVEGDEKEGLECLWIEDIKEDCKKEEKGK